MVVFGLVGGFILNIMPCVLPVLSIKILGVMQHGGKDTVYIRRSFLSSTAGILISFLILAGIVILLRQAGMAAGWGFHFQQPLFLIFVTLVVTLFAANLLGAFEIGLPAFLGSRLATAGHGHGYVAHFFTGMLATLLATPCSAPFLGTAIGFAFSQGPQMIVLIFTVMGVGLALPYILVALFPGMVRMLPRPGMWMVRVRQVMGLLLAGTALWLLWVFAGLKSPLAALALAIALAVVVFALILKHADKLPTTLTTLLLLTGIAGAFLVPQYFSTSSSAHTSVEWVPFDADAIPALVAEGKVVFVDVTADWCVTCKTNKLLVVDRDPVSQILSAPDVIRMQGDYTKPSKPIADYLARYGRYGIPFNAVYGPSKPEGILLPELLTQERVLEAIKHAR
ncbi:MAG: thioredoxin family protein [Hyphomicrobiales bacterium]|nr:thioredoxin family protein [Hyphomicrobiales bacterium]